MLRLNFIKTILRKNVLNIVIILIVFALYFANNLYFKKTSTGFLKHIFVCYFNDFICPLFFLAYSNTLLSAAGRTIKTFWSMMLLCLLAGFVWEYAAPILNDASTTDILDLCCYVSGGACYYLIIRGCAKNEFKRT